jgi:hypothetical protein
MLSLVHRSSGTDKSGKYCLTPLKIFVIKFKVNLFEVTIQTGLFLPHSLMFVFHKNYKCGYRDGLLPNFALPLSVSHAVLNETKAI